MTATHDVHASPSPICALASRSGIAIYWEASILLLLLWMLERLKKCEEDLLDVPSYNELLGEAIL